MRNVQSSHVLQSGGGSGNDAEWPRSHSWDNALTPQDLASMLANNPQVLAAVNAQGNNLAALQV